MQRAEFEARILLNIAKYVEIYPDPNEFLVQIIEHTGGYLNLMTIPDYSDSSGLSYKGASKSTRSRKVREIFNVKWVIDNV